MDVDDYYFEQFQQHDIERVEEDNDAPVGPDEAEEEIVTTRDVKPKKIIVKPRLKLDDKRLKGPRGLCVLEPIFKKAVLRGPGYERRDLDTVMSLLEHWAHRLFPKMTFDDCLEKIEDLGHKKIVSSYVTLLRMDCAEEPVEVTNEEPSRDAPSRSPSPSPQPTIDPFDQLLGRPPQSQLTQEQRERMERNKLLALERRRAKLKAKYEKANETDEGNSQVTASDITSGVVPSENTTDSSSNNMGDNSQIKPSENTSSSIPSENTIDSSSNHMENNSQFTPSENTSRSIPFENTTDCSSNHMENES